MTQSIVRKFAHSSAVGTATGATDHRFQQDLTTSAGKARVETSQSKRRRGNAAWRLGIAMALAALVLCSTIAVSQITTYLDLYDFSCSNGGCQPIDYGSLALGPDGYYYGTLSLGGAYGLGSVFKIMPDGSGFTDLWDFDGPVSGSIPNAALTAAYDSVSKSVFLYGVAQQGGAANSGTVFRVGTAPGSLVVLHTFTAAEGGSDVSPIQPVTGGNLYGTMAGGTYMLTPGGTFTHLSGKAPGPVLGPLFYTKGSFYGVSQSGGALNLGTVFRMTKAGVITVLHSFHGASDGSSPDGPLMLGPGNELYGTTASGGTNGSGGFFSMTLAGHLNWNYSFDPYLGGFACNTQGGAPAAGLTAGPGGLLYGVNSLGGPSCWGTVFETKPGGVPNLKGVPFDFIGNSTCGTCVPGGDPTTTLLLGTDGDLYGLSQGPQTGNFYKLIPGKPLPNIALCCNYTLVLDQPVIIFGQNLGETVQVTVGGALAQFQVNSPNMLTADLPNAAVDGPVVVTLTNPAGLEEQLESQQEAHIAPSITNLDPASGTVGTQVHIVGGGFIGTTAVSFGGVQTTDFSVLTPSEMVVAVPAGAVTGKVAVGTPNGLGVSRQPFTVE